MKEELKIMLGKFKKKPLHFLPRSNQGGGVSRLAVFIVLSFILHAPNLSVSLKKALNLWWQPGRAPPKETAGSGTPALELETELIESIIHHLGNLLQLFTSEIHTSKNFHIKMFDYMNFFVFNDFVTILTKCESLTLMLRIFTLSLTLSKFHASHLCLKSVLTILL